MDRREFLERSMLGATAVSALNVRGLASARAEGNAPVEPIDYLDRDQVSLQLSNARLSPGFAAVQPGGIQGDEQTSIGYNCNTGELFVDAPAGTNLTSISIESAAGVFTGDPAQNRNAQA